MHKIFKASTLFLMLIQIILIFLRVTNYLSCSFWLILTPFWITQVIFVILLLVDVVILFHRKMRLRKVQKEYMGRISHICKVFGSGRAYQEIDPMLKICKTMMRFYYDEPKWITTDEAYVLSDKETDK